LWLNILCLAADMGTIGDIFKAVMIQNKTCKKRTLQN